MIPSRDDSRVRPLGVLSPGKYSQMWTSTVSYRWDDVSVMNWWNSFLLFSVVSDFRVEFEFENDETTLFHLKALSVVSAGKRLPAAVAVVLVFTFKVTCSSPEFQRLSFWQSVSCVSGEAIRIWPSFSSKHRTSSGVQHLRQADRHRLVHLSINPLFTLYKYKYIYSDWSVNVYSHYYIIL